MPARLTTEQWIEKAKAVHGDKYDYSKVVYKNNNTKVTIICPEHGKFEQRPRSHVIDKQGCPICAHDDRAKTCIERYGIARPFLSEESKAKARVTSNERYGGNTCFSSSDIQLQIKQTVRDKYGVDNVMQSEIIKNKALKTNIERYGVVSTAQVEDIRKKQRETMKVRYGVEYPTQSESIREKIKQTNIERYGVANPMQNDSIKVKSVETTEQRYGKGRKSIQSKIIRSWFVKYGVDNPMKVKAIQEQARQTFVEKYGDKNSIQHEQLNTKRRDTIRKKYGVNHVLQLDSFKNKSYLTKKANDSFNKSQSENNLYDMFVQCFGKEDVIRYYKSHEYPFECDIYVKSLDLYVELNALWVHGDGWYDVNKHHDIFTEWSERAKNSEYYRNALEIWTERDVLKRKTAIENNLNYIVFWDTKLRDAILWFAMGCPLGKDQSIEYSWLPDIDLYRDKTVSECFKGQARFYQYHVFYEREIKMWSENMIQSGIRLQPYLYYNRYKYINKLPYQLTKSDLIRAFKISGACKSYTIFDTSLFGKVITKYNIESVYDPCAGWGERFLYCNRYDVEYTGIDINDKLERGYKQMITDLNATKQEFVVGDSAFFKPLKSYNAVITCPPYGNIEIYSDKGAENLSEPEFLKWWDKVVKNCSDIKYFCFQINQRYRAAMTEIVEKNGYVKIDEFVYDNNKSSHFTRKNGINTKKEYEIMLVFEKG